MNVFLVRLLVVFAAIQMAADVIGLVVNPTSIEPWTKTVILTVVFGVTLVWDIGSIGFFGVANVAVLTERRRRNGMYWSTLAAVFTLLGILLLWIPLGISYVLLTIGIEVFLILITVSDGVSAYYLLR